MMKFPVSVLQEFATMKGLPFPNYEMSVSGQSHNPTFSCEVTLDGKSASAIGSTKQAAKHKAASEILELFDIPTSTDCEQFQKNEFNSTLLPPKSNDLACLNYVGKLNEFSSGNRFSQPIYKQSMESMTQFCMLCSFLNFEAKGFGRTKKNAKQDSAKNMLKLIREADLEKSPRNDVPQLNLVKCDQAQTATVLGKYLSLMEGLRIGDSQPTVSPCPDTELLVPTTQVLFSKWEDLENYFDRNGISAQLTVFQKTPLILCLKVNQMVFLNTGPTREEILSRLLFTVSNMVEQGRDLFMSPFQRNCG
ncbi:hypothetical protein HUJ04_011730 [Dendroctonus ponderosae]|uniref:DRBM domain-containing protein n=2 Tax=Dendroctonus ponderosae TaxID=77166 RepID=A0AAR5PX60_DENPD|nr:hypothetical protein HUJ04_011730 [Dendroctonus ponderosae]